MSISRESGDKVMAYEMNLAQEYNEMIQKNYHIESDDTVIKISYENIIDVTEKELVFRNNEGEIQNILLEECAKNFYSAFGVSPEDYTKRQCKCIGGRYAANPISFYEIFTPHHHTRFYMTYKVTRFKTFLNKIGFRAYRKDYSRFWSFERKLRDIGYGTVDLT